MKAGLTYGICIKVEALGLQGGECYDVKLELKKAHNEAVPAQSVSELEVSH